MDPLRLFLVKEVTYGGDGDFSWARLQERYNADLANNLGNLVSRIAAMAEKYRGGTVKATGAPGRLAAVAGGGRCRLPAAHGCVRARERRGRCVPDCRRRQRIHRRNAALGAGERDERQADRLSQVLFDVAEAVRVAGILLLPIMPRSAAEILRRVGEPTPVSELRLAAAEWRTDGERHVLKGDSLWPRAESVKLQTGRSRAEMKPKGTKKDRTIERGRDEEPASPPAAPPAAARSPGAASRAPPPRPSATRSRSTTS